MCEQIPPMLPKRETRQPRTGSEPRCRAIDSALLRSVNLRMAFLLVVIEVKREHEYHELGQGNLSHDASQRDEDTIGVRLACALVNKSQQSILDVLHNHTLPRTAPRSRVGSEQSLKLGDSRFLRSFLRVDLVRSTGILIAPHLFCLSLKVQNFISA